MKYRNLFVSNSSSSSFIVSEDVSEYGICCMELSKEQIELIEGYPSLDGEIHFNLQSGKKYYLTQFLADCNSRYDKIKELEHVFYNEGELNEEPRCEEYYNEYKTGWNSVYLLKEHDVAKQMSFNKFINEYRKSYLPREVIVKYENDGVKLIYVN